MFIFYDVLQCFKNNTLEKLQKLEISERSVLRVRIQELRIPDRSERGGKKSVLIDRTGGLYSAFGLYSRPWSRFSHIDPLSSVNKMVIIW